MSWIREAQLFAFRGSKVALSLFISSFLGAVFTAALRHSPEAMAAYSLSWTIISVPLVVSSGFYILIISYFSPAQETKKENEEGLKIIVAGACFSGLGLLTLLIISGFIISSFLEDRTRELFQLCYWLRIPTITLMPLASVLSGLLILKKRESLMLSIQLIDIFFAGSLTFGIYFFIENVALSLGLFSLFLFLSDISVVCLYYYFLSDKKNSVRESLRGVLPVFRKNWRTCLFQIGQACSGSCDVFVLMISFSLITLLASKTNIETAALTGAILEGSSP